MAVVLLGEIDSPTDWIRELKTALPKTEILLESEVQDVGSIEAALTWMHPLGSLGQFPQLNVIVSTGAGVDHILRDPDLPEVPIVRIVDPNMTVQMSEYVILAVLQFQRRSLNYQTLQTLRRWEYLPALSAASCPVGIMGLGELGTDAAQKLRMLGFPVRGWSRTPKSIPGVECFAGWAEFPEFLRHCQVLVCLLPLTPETDSILNRDTFAKLPTGAYLINSARGQHLVEADLIAALDSGQLSGARLDVFRTEPLPIDHRFWTHPKITITPHIAARTIPATAALQVADAVRCCRSGMPLENVVRRDRGY
jgi:glyoxylate/hydroxypyruvate reductase A